MPTTRRVLVHGYALMSNHFHLVVTGREDGAVSRLLQQVTGPNMLSTCMAG